jgi:NACalpha-BTF3-like transcription factor
MKQFASMSGASKDAAERTHEKAALRLAERTDVSPRQARELLDKHGGDVAAAEKEARNFKAES